ncbi:MAG: hypothetical protein V4795_12240 [Pseudomonadota bacterium]
MTLLAHHLLFVSAGALLLGCSATAWADRPLVSETADVIGAGSCQIETGLATLRASGSPSARVADMLGSCGIAGHSQLGISLASARQAGSTDLSVGLGGKTTLKMPQDGAIGYALAYGISSEKGSGQGWRHGSTRVFGVATKELGKALLGHLNLGWVRTENDRLNSTTWSLGMESEGGLRWAADVFGDDRARPWVSAGLLFPLADRISANLAYAQQFDQPRVRQWTLGFKFEL